MSETSWSPPTGPPIGAPVRPAEARREIEQAIEQARERDRALRDEMVAAAAARVQAADALPGAGGEADEARSLAVRALRRANDAARAGQRADAAKLTGAARVFALRLRDARDRVRALDQQMAAASHRIQQLQTGLRENAGRLEAVAAARMPALSRRKARRTLAEVDETLGEISAPTTDLLAQGAEAARARAARAAEAAAEPEVVPVDEDDLESEVDLGGADDILAELREELGLPGPGPGRPPDVEAGAPERGAAGAASEDAEPEPAAGGRKAAPAGRGGAGPARPKRQGGKQRVPAARR
ncbi:MAG TPA: hypothetical protein VFZ77_14305 [Acidimicrobiales bacterium]